METVDLEAWKQQGGFCAVTLHSDEQEVAGPGHTGTPVAHPGEGALRGRCLPGTKVGAFPWRRLNNGQAEIAL